MEPLTFGIEEEYLVIDATTGALVPRSDEVLDRASRVLGTAVSPELNHCQIEVATPICTDLSTARSHLDRLRHGVNAAALEVGAAAVPLGSHPFSSWTDQRVDLRNERYRRMNDVYQIVCRQQVICGCHVHVGMESRDLAVAIMNRVQPWLPVLLALSANSPYWHSLDTGFVSYRSQVWQRWPTAGMPPKLANAAEFDEIVNGLLLIDAIEDATFLYWYVRPSTRYPTLEFRVCDVCLDVDETIALAGLIRALTWTCAREAKAGRPSSTPRQEIMEAAMWRAGRYGLESSLISPYTLTPRPAEAVTDELLAFVRDALDEHGDTEEVVALVHQIVERGNGAQRQRAAYARDGDLRDVIHAVLPSMRPAG